jgi:hypothetical protein
MAMGTIMQSSRSSCRTGPRRDYAVPISRIVRTRLRRTSRLRTSGKGLQSVLHINSLSRCNDPQSEIGRNPVHLHEIHVTKSDGERDLNIQGRSIIAEESISLPPAGFGQGSVPIAVETRVPP